VAAKALLMQEVTKTKNLPKSLQFFILIADPSGIVWTTSWEPLDYIDTCEVTHFLKKQ